MSLPAPGGDVLDAEDHLLGDAPTEEHGELALEPLLRVGVAVLLGKARRDAQGAAPRHDGDLVDGVQARDPEPQHRVAGLVVRRELPLLLGEDQALALRAEHDLVLGLLEVVHGHLVDPAAGGQERRLVADVGEVGAAHARGPPGEDAEVHVVGQGQLLGVHPQDALAPPHVGRVHHHLAVEAAGTQQRRVQHVGTVGGRQQDDALVGLEAVHLHQERVQGLLPLVVTAAQARTAMAPHRVDLVDEDDARRVGLALLEEVAHPGRAHPDEHLDEVRAGHLEERPSGLAGHGARQQGLSRPRRARPGARPWAAGPPRREKRAGSLRNSMISWSSSLASSAPATSAKVTLGVSGEMSFALERPNWNARFPPPCMVRKIHTQKPMKSSHGKRPQEERPPPRLGLLGGDDDVLAPAASASALRGPAAGPG